MARPKSAGRRTGSVTPRGDDRWLVRWFIGRDEAGKRKYDSKTIEGKKKDAEAFLAAQVVAVESNTYVAPSKQTVKEYLTKWLDHVAKRKVSAATLNSYRSRLTPLFERIGHLRLDRISHETIQQEYTRMLDDASLSPATVCHTHVILKQAFRRAVKTRLLVTNPADHVILPRKVREEMVVWDEKQVSIFLDQTKNHRWHMLWHLLFATGMRPQEVFTLKWADIDGGKLRVQRALVTTGTYGVYEVSQPKTKKGRRTITLPEATQAHLKSYKAAQAAQMLSAGEAFTRNDFVFANEAGQHLDPAQVRRSFVGLVKRSKLPVIRLYGARHTHATILLRACVNPKVVSERLGHSSVVITLDTYSHVLPDTQEEVAAKLDALLFKVS